MTRKIFLLVVVMLLGASIAQAQTNEPQSTINFNVVICETRAVVSFNGTMQAGYDIYYQIFNAANAPLTSLRQVSVSGAYQFAEGVNYDNNQTIPAGGSGYMTVSIAREGNSASSIFSSRANDVQDGCIEPPASTGGTSTGIGGNGDVGAVDPVQGDIIGRANTIISPFGGFLNPDYVPRRAPLVTIGARDPLPVRQQTPGLIFAECNQYPVAFPVWCMTPIM